MSMNRKPDSFPVRLRNMAGAVFFACAFVLAGCAATPTATKFYAAPPLGPTATASIIGSSTTYPDSYTTYLAEIDGLPVAGMNFNNEVRVAPGYRALTVSCEQDSLLASSTITVELKAGHAYILKAERTAKDETAPKGPQENTLYNIWLEDSFTREVVGVKHLAKLNTLTAAGNGIGPVNNDFAGELLLRLIGAVLDVVIEGALEPHNTYAGNAGMKGTQRQGGESPPIKQAPNPPPQSSLPGKLPPRNDAPPPGKLKNP